MTPCFRGSGNCLKFPGGRISKVPEISKIWIPAQRVSRDDDRNRLASSYSEMYEIYENTKCDLNQFFPTPHRRSFSARAGARGANRRGVASRSRERRHRAPSRRARYSRACRRDNLRKSRRARSRRPSARMRILLTGGAGFIGSHVAERLASRHPEYTVRARFRPRVRASNNARTLHPSLARTTDRERLVALDRLSSWTSSTIARA